jgi:hypothetical protein
MDQDTTTEHKPLTESEIVRALRRAFAADFKEELSHPRKIVSVSEGQSRSTMLKFDLDDGGCVYISADQVMRLWNAEQMVLYATK